VIATLTGIYGAGGCGRGIMPLARNRHGKAPDELVFVDDALAAPSIINGQTTKSFKAFCEMPATQKQIAIAVAAPALRAQIASQITAENIPLLSVRADNIVFMDDVEIGEGALISPFVTFTSNIKVGRCFHANLYSYVEHDCVIGDFVTFAPGVQCNGHVHIGDFAYIGAGAVIRQGIVIGANATVGMGAIVTKDVPPGATVVGNPARPLIKN
jgi:sugar O-acyltransferase (sialic acid O-acetyltransferase NeuD family)